MNDWAAAERAWGDHEPQPEHFEQGPWAWELRGDEIADIRFGGTLVLRMVRLVARDRDWRTVPARVTAVRPREGAVELELSLSGFGADISATLSIEASSTLRIRATGEVHAPFTRNRLGLVVLHPPTVAGEPLTVRSPDGGRRRTSFPEHVSPHQPAVDIAALEWTGDGVASVARFEGDVFEMEDQRNWTDASFKTYSTPLSLPFPVELPAGYRFEQSVELESTRVAQPAETEDVPFTLVDSGVFPEIVIAASTDATAQVPAPPAAAILVELETRQPVWRAALARAASTGLPLDLRIVTDDAPDIAAVLDEAAGLSILRVGVFSATSHVAEPSLITALRRELGTRQLGIEVVAGTRAHFTELNRSVDRLDPDADAVTFSITPQMHARERSQLAESIPVQFVVARQAVAIAGGRPLHVGPVTLRPRFNAVSTAPRPAGAPAIDEGYGPALDLDSTDDRQESKALAAWTVASFAALAAAGVAGVCFYEEWGPRGILRRDGSPYPVFDTIARLHALGGQRLLAPDRAQGGVYVLGARSEDVVTVLAANLTADERIVEFENQFVAGSLVVPPFDFAQKTLRRPLA